MCGVHMSYRSTGNFSRLACARFKTNPRAEPWLVCCSSSRLRLSFGEGSWMVLYIACSLCRVLHLMYLKWSIMKGVIFPFPPFLPFFASSYASFLFAMSKYYTSMLALSNVRCPSSPCSRSMPLRHPFALFTEYQMVTLLNIVFPPPPPSPSLHFLRFSHRHRFPGLIRGFS